MLFTFLKGLTAELGYFKDWHPVTKHIFHMVVSFIPCQKVKHNCTFESLLIRRVLLVLWISDVTFSQWYRKSVFLFSCYITSVP